MGRNTNHRTTIAVTLQAAIVVSIGRIIGRVIVRIVIPVPQSKARQVREAAMHMLPTSRPTITSPMGTSATASTDQVDMLPRR
jgi:hypothetical protein